MALPFCTVGHSTRSIQEFTDLLAGAGVELVVDVRRLPGSRRHPQFDEDALVESLPEAGIGYRRIPALGGRRNVDRDIPDDVNGFWQNRSFHNYADHALSGPFREGLAKLLEHGADQHVAVMCSEAVWWRCHRRIIADHLLARGQDVRHVMDLGKLVPARLTEAAVVHPDDGTVTYPAPG